MGKIELVSLEDSKPKIEEFVQTVPYSTPFHSYEWLNALSKNLGLECKVAHFYENSDCIGICPLFPKKVGPLNVHFSPVFATETAYMGILSSKDLNGLLKTLKKEVKNYFMILPPGVSANEGEVESANTIINLLDKPSAEEHIAQVKKGHRYNAKKSEKDGVEVKEDYSDKSIQIYYDLLQETYKASDYNPLPLNFYKDLIKNLHANDKIKFFLAEHSGKVIGGATFLIQGKTMYYWTGGSLKGEFAKLYPNDLIQKRIIEWAYSNGIEKYDMLGASVEGIKKFKLGWGGTVAPYQRVYSSKSLKMMAGMYSKLGNKLKGKLREKVR